MKRLKQLHDTHHQEEADSEGSWAISYGDLVTLLLCFFILFFTVNPSKDQTETLQQELLNIMMREMSSAAQRSPAQAGGPSPGGEARHRQVATEKAATDKPQAEFDDKDAAQWDGKIHKMGSRIVVEFSGISFFKSGKISVTAEGVENLKKFTHLYLPYVSKNQLSIQAFTDLKRVRQERGRKFSDNLELSALRSVAAMRVLQKAGIPLSRMRVGGYGEMKVTARELASVNENEAKAFDLARRVVLVIQPEGRVEP